MKENDRVATYPPQLDIFTLSSESNEAHFNWVQVSADFNDQNVINILKLAIS
jgi:hypothetical protein